MTQEILSDEMRRDALEVRNAEILRWRPEIYRLQLAMDVCQMKKGDLSFCLEGQQVILCQLLPRSGGGKARISGEHAGAGHRKLQKFTA